MTGIISGALLVGGTALIASGIRERNQVEPYSEVGSPYFYSDLLMSCGAVMDVSGIVLGIISLALGSRSGRSTVPAETPRYEPDEFERYQARYRTAKRFGY
ncbi:MAG: hypothetical protein ACYTFG_02480 [Planctomycetota bacterium]